MSDVTLREHVEALMVAERLRVDERFAAQDKGVSAALAAADRAVTKAEVAVEKRFDGVNEFRQALNDQTKTFIPRVEAEKQTANLTEKIEEINKRVTRGEGNREGMSATWGWVFAGIGALIGVAGFAFALLKSH